MVCHARIQMRNGLTRKSRELCEPRGKMERAALIVISALFAGLLCLGNASAKAPESCHGDLIRVHLGSFGGAGGQDGQAVVVTNRAHSACAVSGFAKFSAFTAAGGQGSPPVG